MIACDWPASILLLLLWCENLENDIPNSHGGYLGKLKETQAHAMARNNENDDEGDQPDGVILNGENQESGTQSRQNLGLDSGNGFSDGEEATTNTSKEEIPSVERRYPLRNRKAKQFDHFILWDMIPKGGGDVSSI